VADIIDLSSQLLTGPLSEVRLYAVPNASMLVFQDLINATWNLALTQSTAVGAKTAAITAASGMLDPTLAPQISGGSVSVPSITAPAVNIPANITVPSLFADWKTEYLDLANWLVGEYTSWISTYAPNNQALYAAGESSLLAAIQSDTYIPAAVQANIMGDASAAILSDKVRAQDAVVAQFAARRFPMPAAASTSAIMQIEQKAQDAMAEAGRKIMVMSVEQYRFVIEKVIAARGMILEAANKYVLAIASAPDAASKLLGVGYDIQTKLISAAAQFYNADAQAKEVIAKVGQFNTSLALDVSKANQASELQIIEDNLKALLGEIGSITQQATALFNNLHVQASMSAGGTTVSTQAI